MVTLGSDPGVTVTSTSGAVGGVTVGREQYLVLVGVGNSNANSSVNTPESITSRSDVDSKYGADSDLALAYRRARANGANPDYIKGIMASTTQTTDSETASSTGTLSNTPVVGGPDRITATDTGNSTDLTPIPKYESPPSAPSASDEIHYNPNTGEWAVATSTDVDFQYEYADWSAAAQTLDVSLQEGDFAVIHPLTSAESVASTFATEVGNVRDDFKMANLVMAAEPNKTTSDGYATFDTSTYSHALDDDTIFLFGTASDQDDDQTGPLTGIGMAPAIAGKFAGNSPNNPVYNDTVSGTGKLGDQYISQSHLKDLRNEYVIPIRDVGTPTIKDNRSTYDQASNGGWERDFFHRRVVDLTIALAQRLGESVLGEISDEESRVDLQERLVSELEDLVGLGLLVSGGQYVEVYEKSQTEYGVDMGITPQGVTKTVSVDLTIAV